VALRSLQKGLTNALRIDSARQPNALRSVEVAGVGIHSGGEYRVQISLAPQDHGIEFYCYQADGVFSAPARYTRLSGTTRSTALVLRGKSRRKIELRTVEHFLAAAFVSGLRDLKVEISVQNNDTESSLQELFEMPILDGAGLAWWDLLSPLREARMQSGSFKAWLPLRSFEIANDSKKVLISPHSDREDLSTSYNCAVRFEPCWEQVKDLKINWLVAHKSFDKFVREIAPARTFGFMHELRALEARGLAKGGSLENALVIDGDRVVNVGGFRVEGELAAHKLLDVIGDFALLEYPVLGRIDAVQAGHHMHLRALEEAVRTGALILVEVDSSGHINRNM
jgi:UDP-3-O-[3-hydroxymyristoyl] N-acetylglucosamine deacetylase